MFQILLSCFFLTKGGEDEVWSVIARGTMVMWRIVSDNEGSFQGEEVDGRRLVWWMERDEDEGRHGNMGGTGAGLSITAPIPASIHLPRPQTISVKN